MDIIEFNQSLGYTTPKDISDNFSKTLAMYCITYGYEVDVIVKKKSNRTIYLVSPKDKSNIDHLINSINETNTIVHGTLFKFHATKYEEKKLCVEIIKGQY